MHFFYKLLTYIFYPFSFVYLFIRKIKKKEDPTRYKEKLAQIDELRGEGFLIWFHVASVGEGLSILPLIENFEQEQKVKKILITSITLSSAAVLKKRLENSEKVVHQFLPLDIPHITFKFLKHWSPNLAIFIDSEIWPNLIFQIKEKKIPLLLVNARITKKTFSGWRLTGKFGKKIFQKFDLCIAANNESENYLKILGSNNIKNYGNLKFAKTKHNHQDIPDPHFVDKIKNKKIWCASSTHKSEEIFCAYTHLKLKENYKDILTIIIPRHISRIKSISSELSKLNLKVVLYSNFDNSKNDFDILLIDTYGETSKFFGISKYVFLGGSLIKHGGQNPIEASRLGCKVFHGPNVYNFTEIYKFLNSLGISKQVDSNEELNQSLVEEFKQNRPKNIQIIEKIDNYGLNVLNNVIKDIKKYI